MKSIFYDYDVLDDWKVYSEEMNGKASDVIFTSPLTTKIGTKTKKRTYSLTVNSLIQHNSKDEFKKSLNICWKLVDPFYEKTAEGEVYGFNLTRYEFFVDSSEILDKWLFWLRRLSINTTFDSDFIIIKEIGKGATSTIYLIEESITKYQFAAKCFSKHLLWMEKPIYLSLISELKELFNLVHENIARLYYTYESLDRVFLIMENFPRSNLLKRLNYVGKFSDAECRLFMTNLLKALAYMHEKNVMHRDIKPENIMMTSKENFNIKIIDFGLAFQIENEKVDDVCGSIGYMAPEVIENRYYGVKADVFSAGVLLYYLATGKHPFEACTAKRMEKKNRKCKYDIKAVKSSQMQSFILDAMNPDQKLRKSAQELLSHPWIISEEAS